MVGPPKTWSMVDRRNSKMSFSMRFTNTALATSPSGPQRELVFDSVAHQRALGDLFELMGMPP